MAKAPRVPGETSETQPETAAEPLPATPAPATGELPNWTDVDPKKIAEPTLTKQGWIIPDRPTPAAIR